MITYTFQPVLISQEKGGKKETYVTNRQVLLRQNPRASLVATLAWLKKKGPKTGENVRAAQDDDEEAAASSSSIRRLCDYVATTIAPCWTPKGEGDGDEEGMSRVCLLFF